MRLHFLSPHANAAGTYNPPSAIEWLGTLRELHSSFFCKSYESLSGKYYGFLSFKGRQGCRTLRPPCGWFVLLPSTITDLSTQSMHRIITPLEEATLPPKAYLRHANYSFTSLLMLLFACSSVQLLGGDNIIHRYEPYVGNSNDPPLMQFLQDVGGLLDRYKLHKPHQRKTHIQSH